MGIKSFKENKIKKENYIKNLDNNYKKSKIIVLAGVFGVGKSIISIYLSNYLSINNKVLLIDMDKFNYSINTILGINKLPENYKKNNFESLIIKYKNNFDVLISCNILEDGINDNYYNIEFIFNNLINKYDYIVIDTSSKESENINKFIFNKCSKIVFLIEPNLSEIKKSNYYLEILINDWNIDISKINIIFNKTNKYIISKHILNEIYSDINIIGEIEYNEKFNLSINKNKIKDIYFNTDIFEKIAEEEI